MSVFRAIVFTAAAAGLCVGLTVTAIQHVGPIPLILKAEVYEKQAEAARQAAPAPEAPAAASAHGQDGGGHNHAGHDHGGHDHAAAAWEPTDGLERNAYTALFNVVEWIGFGLGLAGLLVVARRPASWREGLFWGLGGFAAFALAPGLGLPPELPGAPAAELGARQAWWIGTALATASGLALMALGRSVLLGVLGGLLVVAPHVIGAPQLAEGASAVPDALSRQFTTAVTVTTFISWALLGALTGDFLRRFGGAELKS
ncbi:cobalt transporter [Alsobacter soli]|uniref:Cobalt transporter n=1 Tax=Alsobacter soli TaxID=2109933 RepID=A0A2T1HZJ5_9HYPH|nr:CbtA family protein [Alsobacter soli]PSC07055.1 cobalt transporter [Alsobacter soli]